MAKKKTRANADRPKTRKARVRSPQGNDISKHHPNKHSVEVMRRLARDREIVRLRRFGFAHADIRDIIAEHEDETIRDDLTVQRVRQILIAWAEEARAGIIEDVEAERQLQSERLVEMLQAAYPAAIGADGAIGAPNPLWFDRSLKVIEALNKLNGFDAPQKVQSTVAVEGRIKITEEKAVAKRAELAKRLEKIAQAVPSLAVDAPDLGSSDALN